MFISGSSTPARAVASAVLIALALAGCGAAPAIGTATISRADTPLPASVVVPPPPPTPRPVLGPLFDPAMPLTAPPLAVPLEYRMPSLGVDTPVLAVGKAPGVLIDAPEGRANDPVWTKAFWFRGGAAPGAPGVTTIIGHVDDTLARPDPFAKIRQLHAGDVVEVVDQRSGEIIHYRITSTEVVWNSGLRGGELARLFGAGAVSGKASDKLADAASGVARLTLMTCTGSWRGGGFDRRFFAFGVRDETVPQSQ